MPNETELAVSLIFVFSLILAEIWAYRKKRKNVLISFAVTTAVIFVLPIFPLGYLAAATVNFAQIPEIIASSLLSCVCALFRISNETLYYDTDILSLFVLPLAIAGCLIALPADFAASCDRDKQYDEAPSKKKASDSLISESSLLLLQLYFASGIHQPAIIIRLMTAGRSFRKGLKKKDIRIYTRFTTAFRTKPTL